MAPTLMPGDRVIIRRLNADQPLPPNGSIVVAWHPKSETTRIVKRLTGCSEAGLLLLGDNPSESSDSRQFGSVGRHLLIGEVTAVLR